MENSSIIFDLLQQKDGVVCWLFQNILCESSFEARTSQQLALYQCSFQETCFMVQNFEQFANCDVIMTSENIKSLLV